jgi:PPOX class probable F420-dependent enzyme
MPVTLPQSVKKLLQDKAYGHVVTFNAQGKPQLTMVWMDVDGDEVTFNTAEGRTKPQNLRRDPRIIVSVQDRHDPQAYAVFHGKARVTETGADDHIDKLADRKYGLDRDFIAFLQAVVLLAKLAQKAQRRQVVALQMPHLTCSQPFWLDFIKA